MTGRCCTMNVCSLRNRATDFIDYVFTCRADILALAETCLKVSDSAFRFEATPPGYKLVDHTCDKRSGGSTALLLSDSVTVKKVAVSEKTSFEFSEWLVVAGSHQLHVVIIYRPP